MWYSHMAPCVQHPVSGIGTHIRLIGPLLQNTNRIMAFNETSELEENVLLVAFLERASRVMRSTHKAEQTVK